MRTAVLTMDIEDWWHLDYIDRCRADREYSMLDGLAVYRDVLERHGIRSSYFVLGELIGPLQRELRELDAAGHDVGAHGWDHQRPLTMAPQAFLRDVVRSRQVLEAALGRPVLGYRAPCYSLDRQRLELLGEAGYVYDSSRIDFSDHPLYGTIDLAGFEQPAPCVFRKEGFLEFQVTTLGIAGKQVPISGGGYLRIFPWALMRRWIQRYLRSQQLYVLYIHPFELSQRPAPRFPSATTWRQQLRFGIGRSGVRRRLELLIELLQENGYEFATFAELHGRICGTPYAAGSQLPNQTPVVRAA